jgi:glutathione S-transferase
MKPVLSIGNRNYSSWSLRPWLALTWANIEHDVRVIRLGDEGYMKQAMPEILAVSPSGTVPALQLADCVIGDSLAIAEWAAEQAPNANLWPTNPIARACARAATAEMHAGFSALRKQLPCNIRRRAEKRALSPEVQRDVARICAIWTDLHGRFGSAGPYLCGAQPGIVDAFFTPVATRFRTYGVELALSHQRYIDTLLSNSAFRAWEALGNAEPWVMPECDQA